MLTLNRINKEIENQGYDCELIRGCGYFYFSGKSVDGAHYTSICVSRVNALTVQQWMQELANVVK